MVAGHPRPQEDFIFRLRAKGFNFIHGDQVVRKDNLDPSALFVGKGFDFPDG